MIFDICVFLLPKTRIVSLEILNDFHSFELISEENKPGTRHYICDLRSTANASGSSELLAFYRVRVIENMRRFTQNCVKLSWLAGDGGSQR